MESLPTQKLANIKLHNLKGRQGDVGWQEVSYVQEAGPPKSNVCGMFFHRMGVCVCACEWGECPVRHLQFTFLVFSSVESLFYCQDTSTRLGAGTASTQADNVEGRRTQDTGQGTRDTGQRQKKRANVQRE